MGVLEVRQIGFCNFLKLNYFKKKIITRKNGTHIFPMKNTIFIADKKTHISVNGNLKLNANTMVRDNGRSTICRFDKNSQAVFGTDSTSVQLYYGCDLIVFEGGNFEFLGGFCNSDTKIRCKNRIFIGKNAVISHNVTIQDFDGHQLYETDEHGEKKEKAISAPVIIEDNVWIASGAKILKGVRIGTGSVVAAGSVVVSDIPPHCLCAGVPARVIKENIQWE